MSSRFDKFRYSILLLFSSLATIFRLPSSFLCHLFECASCGPVYSVVHTPKAGSDEVESSHDRIQLLLIDGREVAESQSGG